ncbi:MAG: hypothetical protein WD267_09325 [Balneolales bacterium]
MKYFYNIPSMTLIMVVSLSIILFNCSEEPGGNLIDSGNSGEIGDTIPTPSSDYHWGSLPIGGGGYVTGIAIHPVETDNIYIRTDVGGAYRWNSADEKWEQMLDWVGPENGNLFGADGMALDKNKPDRIYLALGTKVDQEGGVFRSEDRGESWTNLFSANFEANGREGRWVGENLAVDPNNSNVIYAGTRKDGLWRSVDDGANWSRVSSVSRGHIGGNPTGVRSIVFDPADKSDGRSSTIYVGVPSIGIFLSSDGGDSFALMEGSPQYPARMQVVDNELFVTHSTGVMFLADGIWKNITPPKGNNRNYVALAVDETDNNKLVVAERYGSFYNPIYRSSDKGESWEQINTNAAPATLHVNIPWWNKSRFSSATAGMEFVPGGSGELFYTDWFGVWQTPNVWASNTDWYTKVKGHEETVILTLVAPPEGALVYSGMADVFGFRHDAIDEYPAKALYSINEGFSIAVCEESPSNIAILGARTWGGEQSRLAISSDYGETWEDRSLPSGTTLGKIAISSTDPDRIVYVAAAGSVYYTTNRGATWKQAEGAPENAVRLTDIWNKDFALSADLVDGERFYLFHEGKLFASTDGGATWEAQNETDLPDQSGYLNVVSAPGMLGEVWVSLDKNGLWKSSNGGKNFTKVSSLGSVSLITWGAAAPGASNPSAYAYGTQGGKWGLYRSVNMGGSWTRINNDDYQFPAGAKALAGDRNVFGRIFVGSGGFGISYGELN